MPENETSAEIDSLSDLGLEDLRQTWQARLGGQAPTVTSSRLLRSWLAWELQARVQGGFDPATRRQLRELERAKTDGSRLPRISSLRPGTVLIREHAGKTHRVMVLERGYAWDGGQYGSLTEIAYRITGTRWSGPRFFGLKNKERRP
ncbi:MAG: DUF2924 domain-containing protein [Proteobacteria bacterium]|nr:DUF2924 domain-containing protein [Pseudomonadota bacterium]